jgi:hypothetical protein
MESPSEGAAEYPFQATTTDCPDFRLCSDPRLTKRIAPVPCRAVPGRAASCPWKSADQSVQALR